MSKHTTKQDLDGLSNFASHFVICNTYSTEQDLGLLPCMTRPREQTFSSSAQMEGIDRGTRRVAMWGALPVWVMERCELGFDGLGDCRYAFLGKCDECMYDGCQKQVTTMAHVKTSAMIPEKPIPLIKDFYRR